MCIFVHIQACKTFMYDVSPFTGTHTSQFNGGSYGSSIPVKPAKCQINISPPILKTEVKTPHPIKQKNKYKHN